MDRHLRGVWKVRNRGSGLGGVEGDGGDRVREGVGGQNNGLRRVWWWNLAKVWCGKATLGALGFKPRGSRVRAKRKVILALNRATSRRSGATSRRSIGENS